MNPKMGHSLAYLNVRNLSDLLGIFLVLITFMVM